MKPVVDYSRVLVRLRIGIQASELMEPFDYVEEVPLWMKDMDGRYRWVARR